MYRNTEIRKLPAGSLINLAHILETNNDWKKVMSLIPKNLELQDSEPFEPKYNHEHIRLIEDYAKGSNKKCAEVLFDEWGTSGQVRPTLGTLKEIMIRAQIFRAADEIANILQEPLPPRPSVGPAASINTDISFELNNENTGQSKGLIPNTNNSYAEGRSTLGNQTTLPIKSHDLIQFSSKSVSMGNPMTGKVIHTNTNEVEYSFNIPNVLNDIQLNSQQSFYENDTNRSIQTTSASFNNHNSDLNQNKANSQDFQTTFPNINIASFIDNEILEDTNLINFSYQELRTCTNGFSQQLSNLQSGPIGKIGSGGFGEVFAGFHEKYGRLAVKKVNQSLISGHTQVAIRVFNAEVRYLSQFRHQNIVPIMGFCKDGPSPCMVCAYIEGGSLQQKIAEKILREDERIDIMLGTAEGLKYLHKSEGTGISDSSTSDSKKGNFVHGDVKSANILLTKDFVPKLCDFGLAKQYETTCITLAPMGTSAYMAPEGFAGTITQKSDVFSFGIVLLEILTGLRPVVNNGKETINIKNYIEDHCTNNTITALLDTVVPEWSRAKEMYDLAQLCLKYERKSRPSIDHICNVLNDIKY